MTDASSGATLAGRWQGYFMNTASVGDSRFIHGDDQLQFNEDGTYAGTRTTRLVAGSSRGGQSKLAGRIVANERRVTRVDDAGCDLTLTRKGNVLYGVSADPGTEWPIMVDIEKVQSTGTGTESP
jgi:hypothetical protein